MFDDTVNVYIISSYVKKNEQTSCNFQTDVVGICETMYMPTRKNGDFQTYQKIKHMETCRNNQELFQYALNLPDMNIQNLPLMRYVIQRNVILGKRCSLPFYAMIIMLPEIKFSQSQ